MAKQNIDLVIGVLSRITTTHPHDTAKVEKAALLLAGIYGTEVMWLGKSAHGGIVQNAPGGGLRWKWSDMRSTLTVLRWARGLHVNVLPQEILWKWSDMRSTLTVLRSARGLSVNVLPQEIRALDTVIAELETMVTARRFEGPLPSIEFVERSLFMMKGDPPFNAARDTAVRILEMMIDAGDAPRIPSGARKGRMRTKVKDMQTTLHVLAVLRTSFAGEQIPASNPFRSFRSDAPKNPHPELPKWIAAVDQVMARVNRWKTRSSRGRLKHPPPGRERAGKARRKNFGGR